MSGDQLCASFQREADAFRAASQLHAAGLSEDDVVVSRYEDGAVGLRADAGVPDDGASLEGLRVDDPAPPRGWRLTIGSLGASRLSREATLHLIDAAGGRVED